MLFFPQTKNKVVVFNINCTLFFLTTGVRGSHDTSFDKLLKFSMVWRLVGISCELKGAEWLAGKIPTSSI